MTTLLIVGLGNPGSSYAETRHNAGFRVLDHFAANDGSWKEKFSGAILQKSTSDGKVILLKPDTYMNESGRSVAPAAAFYKIPPEHICVVHDELDFPLGSMRFKLGGGDGGHNGLKSVSKSLSTKNYMRLRIGIGRPKIPQNADNGDDLVHSWVLGKFSKGEKPPFEQVLGRASEALELLVRDGFEAAQMYTNGQDKLTIDRLI